MKYKQKCVPNAKRKTTAPGPTPLQVKSSIAVFSSAVTIALKKQLSVYLPKWKIVQGLGLYKTYPDYKDVSATHAATSGQFITVYVTGLDL